MEILGGFLNSLLSFIIKLVFWFMGILASILIYPIQALLVTAFPTIGEALSNVLTWSHNSLFPMISFVKEVVIGILCIPRPLFTALIGILAFRVGIVPTIRFIKSAINLWNIAKGNIKIN